VVARAGRHGRATGVSLAGRPRAVLDADIIYSRVLHDLMGRMARDLRVLDLFWSEELLAETRRSLEAKKQLPPTSAQRWVGYLQRNFPNGRIDLDQTLATDLVQLTRDPFDIHVCALAVAARADYLFTHDRGYMRDALGRYGVQVAAPDEFLASILDADTQGMLAVLERQANAWAGGHPITELLDALDRAGAPTLAAKVRAHI
jgi:predicted nucleic acid-binding protein